MRKKSRERGGMKEGKMEEGKGWSITVYRDCPSDAVVETPH